MGINEKINQAISHKFGKDYQLYDLKTFIPREQSQFEAIEKMKTHDFLKNNLYLFSKKNRTGKTTAQAMLYREVVRCAGFGVSRVFSDAELQSDCRFAFLENNTDHLLSRYKYDKFFFFKDFAKADIEDGRIQPVLFEFMDYLFSNSPPKVLYFASNYSPEEISKLPGRCWLDIATRIHEKCKVIEF